MSLSMPILSGLWNASVSPSTASNSISCSMTEHGPETEKTAIPTSSGTGDGGQNLRKKLRQRQRQRNAQLSQLHVNVCGHGQTCTSNGPESNHAVALISPPTTSSSNTSTSKTSNTSATSTSTRSRTRKWACASLIPLLVLAYTAGLLCGHLQFGAATMQTVLASTSAATASMYILPSSSSSSATRNLRLQTSPSNYDTGIVRDHQELLIPSRLSLSLSQSLSDFPFDNLVAAAAAMDNTNSTHQEILQRPIFYHIYIPHENPQPALQIVREQLSQLSHQQVTPTLFYNVVGNHNALPLTLMTKWCQKFSIQCHFGRNFETGTMEDRTLQHVYEFCQKRQPSFTSSSSGNNVGLNTATYMRTIPGTAGREVHQRVAYMHNKGSHHPSILNEQWRFLMTQALARDACWKDYSNNGNSSNNNETNSNNASSSNNKTNNTPTKNHEEQCNICGLYFSTDRGLYMAGNIWTADCTYINRLKPPNQFEIQMRAVAQGAMLQRVLGKFITTQYPLEPEYFGLGRYAAEWWLGSHPTIQPCDFSSSFAVNHRNNFDRTKDFLDFVLVEARRRRQRNRQIIKQNGRGRRYLTKLKFTAPAPYHPYKLPNMGLLKRQETGEDGIEPWKKEYFLLLGMVYRWLHLYQQLPSEDSWVWDHFPYGNWWREELQANGTKVLEQFMGVSVADTTQNFEMHVETIKHTS